jgi:hypothetical protein
MTASITSEEMEMEKITANNDSQLRADDLEDRLVNFAVRIIKLSAKLPKTSAGKHKHPGKSFEAL